jgi:hypothetical protein
MKGKLACDGDHAAPRCADPQCWHGDRRESAAHKHRDRYRVSITLTQGASRALDLLLAAGLHGSRRSEVARRLVDEGLAKRVLLPHLEIPFDKEED